MFVIFMNVRTPLSIRFKRRQTNYYNKKNLFAGQILSDFLTENRTIRSMFLYLQILFTHGI